MNYLTVKLDQTCICRDFLTKHTQKAVGGV